MDINKNIENKDLLDIVFDRVKKINSMEYNNYDYCFFSKDCIIKLESLLNIDVLKTEKKFSTKGNKKINTFLLNFFKEKKDIFYYFKNESTKNVFLGFKINIEGQKPITFKVRYIKTNSMNVEQVQINSFLSIPMNVDVSTYVAEIVIEKGKYFQVISIDEYEVISNMINKYIIDSELKQIDDMKLAITYKYAK